MINLTLKQFRYFEALARHRHFGRAADACAITQPALSMQMKELEKTLGTPLFERAARQVRLSEFGEEFLLRVRTILRSVDELQELALASHNRLVRRLRIGIIPTIAPYLLPTLITKLTEMNGDIDLHVRETVTPKLIQEVMDGRLDTAIVALPISEPSSSNTGWPARRSRSCFGTGRRRSSPRNPATTFCSATGSPPTSRWNSS